MVASGAKVRQNQWKLVVQHPTPGSYEKTRLYHLAKDPGETNNLAQQHPEKVPGTRKPGWPKPMLRQPSSQVDGKIHLVEDTKESINMHLSGPVR